MHRRKQLLLAPLLIFILAASGCIHKTGGQVTPWEKVTTANAVLAQSINTVTHGTIAAQQSGLLSVQQAAPILNFAEQAAKDDVQITAVLANTPSVGSIPQLKALVDDIGTAAKNAIASGGVGVKNPKSQQTIGADIDLVVTAADSILTNYQAATGGTN